MTASYLPNASFHSPRPYFHLLLSYITVMHCCPFLSLLHHKITFISLSSSFPVTHHFHFLTLSLYCSSPPPLSLSFTITNNQSLHILPSTILFLSYNTIIFNSISVSMFFYTHPCRSVSHLSFPHSPAVPETES